MARGTAGAASATNHRQNLARSPSKQQLKEQKKRRKEVDRQRKETIRKADIIFDKFVVGDGECMKESQVQDFVAQVLSIDPLNLEPHALQLVIDTARSSNNNTAKGEEQHADADGGSSGKLDKESLIDAIEKYGEYVKKAKQIDEIYNTFDKNHNELLDRNEFRKALEAYERKQKRESDGLQGTVVLFITESDLDFILRIADVDGDGNISKNEILPALAAWEELAAVKVEQAECSCVIL